jgi:BirA family biotin operon repressor/biotin-[acetyl-CoA-carboxylase] ligase
MNTAALQNLPWLRQVDHRLEVGSTNDVALGWAADPALATPALVVAERQTAGRGQRSNRWWSSEGSLTFSLVVQSGDAGLMSEAWPRLPLATAVALGDALHPLAPGVPWGIRWPNDLFAGGRKIAGVLVEAPNLPNLKRFTQLRAEGDQRKPVDRSESPHNAGREFSKVAVKRRRAVIGVGVNVNNSWVGAPAELSAVGVALCDLSGRPHDRGELLAEILTCIERRLTQLGQNDPELAAAWRDRCLLRGQVVCVEVGDSPAVEGVCEGIDDHGALVVHGANGPRRISSGKVLPASAGP